MPETIADRLAAQPKDAKAIGRRLYVELLRADKADHGGDQEALAMAAHLLGKSADQIKADIIIVKRLVQLEQLANTADSAAFTSQQAQKLLNQFEIEAAKLADQQRQRSFLLKSQVQEAGDKLTAAQNAALEIQQLRQQQRTTAGLM